MNKKQYAVRCALYLLGVIVLALGIVLNTKTQLGVSPIISIPNNIAVIWNWNLGAVTFLFYTLCVGMEFLLAYKKCSVFTLLQISMSLVTSCFINFFNQRLNFDTSTYTMRFLVLAAAIVITGIGAATMVNMQMIPNPADALANVIGQKIHRDMGFGKNVFDISCFTISCIIGLLFVHRIVGIGAGTVIAVILTGRVIALFNRLFKKNMQRAAGIAVS